MADVCNIVLSRLFKSLAFGNVRYQHNRTEKRTVLLVNRGCRNAEHPFADREITVAHFVRIKSFYRHGSNFRITGRRCGVGIFLPAQKLHGSGVVMRDNARFIHGNNALADAVKHGAQPVALNNKAVNIVLKSFRKNIERLRKVTRFVASLFLGANGQVSPRHLQRNV